MEGIDQAEILEIIDHHRIGSMETDGPVYFRNVPVGCTCTIIYQMYRENGVELDRSTAGLLLSAILSDTLMFRSPTCTPLDEQAGRELAKLTGVDLEATSPVGPQRRYSTPTTRSSTAGRSASAWARAAT